MKLYSPAIVILACSLFGVGQTQPEIRATGGTATAVTTTSDAGALVSRIETETTGLSADLSKLRIDKWKADSGAKQQAGENAASIQRNVHAALPELVAGVRSAPQTLGANFKLYRNLNALYDVVSSLAESAGAFGKREEYESIAPHVAALDDIRRSYADSLQQMAANADNRISQAQRAQAAVQQAPAPKKIIVDDNAPSPAPKKKKTRKSTASSSSAGTSTPQ
ncbi:MAG: hypothetical protein JO065_15740 [Acidobacteria bacterium]|nr:hypothetical protein [Acidobacteriota bacterium]